MYIFLSTKDPISKFTAKQSEIKSANTKKHEDENRDFNLKWEKEYAFTIQDNKPSCLICHKLLGQNKCSNVNHHNKTNHKTFQTTFYLNQK